MLEYTLQSQTMFQDIYQIHETINQERIYLCDLIVPDQGDGFYAVPLGAGTKFNHWELMEMFPQLPRIEYPRKGRPTLPATQKRVKVAITLTPEHHAKTQRNRSKIITEALRLYFAE